jgi:hypothetical protein
MVFEDACSLAVDLTRDLATARARLADVQADRDVLRELLTVALDELAALIITIDRQTATIVHLHNELRRARVEVAA